MCVPWVSGLDTCPICAEDFEKFWDENADGGNGDWMIRNALDPGSGQVVHSGCWRGLMDGGGGGDDGGGDDGGDDADIDAGEGEGEGEGGEGAGAAAGSQESGADRVASTAAAAGGGAPVSVLTGGGGSMPSSASAGSGGDAAGAVVMEEVFAQPHTVESTPTPPAQVSVAARCPMPDALPAATIRQLVCYGCS